MNKENGWNSQLDLLPDMQRFPAIQVVASVCTQDSCLLFFVPKLTKIISALAAKCEQIYLDIFKRI